MAVLIRHRAEGMTEAQYDEIAPPLVEKVKSQPGFLFHTAFTDKGQFTVSEIWESQEQHDTWFDANVAPNLPMTVQQEVVELHAVQTP
jgi:quinol monooxygenase YgiN